MTKKVSKAQADKNFKMIMQILKEEKQKMQEEKEWKDTVKRVYSKPKPNYNKLTTSVKKAAEHMPGSVDFNSPENMYYSEKNTQKYLQGTSYYETYSAMRSQDDWD